MGPSTFSNINDDTGKILMVTPGKAKQVTHLNFNLHTDSIFTAQGLISKKGF